MDIRVLGPVRVLDGGRTMLRVRRRERLLLGLLALESGRAISVSRLIALLWDDEAPKRPRETLQVYVSRLRSQLAGVDGRPGLEITHHGDGYLLQAEPETVDAHRFLAKYAAAADVTDPTERSSDLRTALEMWDGPLLADAADDALRARLGGSLEEARLAALELRVEADLQAGRLQVLVPELAELVSVHADRERLVAAYMKALYRCGRIAEALGAYRDAAAELADRLGLDFSDDLNDLYIAMLRRDPALDPDSGTSTAQLPPSLSTFLGRDREVATITALADPEREVPGRPTVCAIDGMAGVGKTALAVHVGHQLASRFPDGQIYLDLHGFTAGVSPVEPAEALDRLLRTRGNESAIPSHVDDRSAVWRSWLKQRKLLLVIDNVVNEAQVSALLPAAPGCLVIVTSRRSLAGLDDVTHVSLAPLPEAEATRLFNRLVGSDRAPAEPEVAAQIGRLCGGLPLAVRIAAARLVDQPYWTVERLVRRLQDRDRRLAEFDVGNRSMATALDLSYRHLPESAQRAFRLLGLFSAQPFDGDDAAALLDADRIDTELTLVELAAARLIQPCGPDQYRFHDLVGEYAALAADRDESAEARRAALIRLVDHYRAVTNFATYRIEPGRTQLREESAGARLPELADGNAALAWYDDHHVAIKAAVEIAAAQGLTTHCWQICAAAAMYYELRKRYDDWAATHRIAVDMAKEHGDERAQVEMLYRLLVLYWRTRDFTTAIDCARQARVLSRRLGDIRGRATVFNNLAGIYAQGLSDLEPVTATQKAGSYLEEALRHYRALDDQIGEAKALNNLGELHLRRGHYNEALSCLDGAFELFTQLDRPFGRASALRGSAQVHADRGDTDAAVAQWVTALEISREHGSTETELETLERLGRVLRDSGRDDEAVRWYAELSAAIPGHIPAAEQLRLRHAIADSYLASGDSEAALRQYQLAQRFALSGNDTTAARAAQDAIAELAGDEHATGDER